MSGEVSLAVDSKTSLRALSIHDAKELFDIVDSQRSYLREFLGWLDLTKSQIDSENFIRNARESNLSGATMILGIFYEDRLTGIISLFDIRPVHRSAAMGYWISRSAQGKGLATRSAERLIAYGFEELNLHRIEIRAAPQNRKSRQLAERLGFTFEGQLREAEQRYGQFNDLCLYSLLRSDRKT